jgi:hypothetical protein
MAPCSGLLSPVFVHVHDLCVDRDGNIIVVQWAAGGASPIKLEAVKSAK